MSRTLMLCLANSKKHGGRCLAGIEVEPAANGRYSPVRAATGPRWIRPVGATDHGEIPTRLVERIQLLDIVELHDVVPVPAGYQSENVRFDSRKLSTTDRIKPDRTELRRFVSLPRPTIFGNRGKAVPADKAQSLDHSLLFLGPLGVAFSIGETSSGKTQVRGEFKYTGNDYDFPVTDLAFEQAFLRDERAGRHAAYFLTLSLGVEHDGWDYKLIAGVIAV